MSVTMLNDTPETSGSLFDNFLKTNLSGEVMSSLIVMAIVAILALIVGILANNHDPLKKPRGLLLIAEIGVTFFDRFTEDLLGKRLPGFGGVIMTCAVYLFISFIWGLTGLPSPVTSLAVPLSLGLTAFLSIHLVSAKFTKWGYFKRYIDPFPVLLPINLISMWAPLISLTLRLFGNATAGYVLMSLIYEAVGSIGNQVCTLATESVHVGNFIAPFITPVLHAYFDLFSALIQTTVFISLTAIFVGQEIPEEE